MSNQMSLYLKIKKDFVEVSDYSSIKVTDMVKVYSRKSNKFISKSAYLVKNIHNIDTTLQIDGEFRYFSPPTGSLSLSPLHIDIISGKKRVARAWRRRPR